MEKEVRPILLENQLIYNNYYLDSNKNQWEKFEKNIIVNNSKIKNLINKNRHLFEDYKYSDDSNRKTINNFILHVDEFQRSRSDEEKIRKMLYPKKLNSIFGIEQDFHESFLQSVASIESLISVYLRNNKFDHVNLAKERPYIQLNKLGENEKIYLDNLPRLKQLCHSHKCFRKTKVRMDDLNFALKYLNNNKITFHFKALPSLREIIINSYNIVFVYEYCLTQEYLYRKAFSQGTIVVNLHGWNDDKSISKEARELASTMEIKLLTKNEYFSYVHKIK